MKNPFLSFYFILISIFISNNCYSQDFEILKDDEIQKIMSEYFVMPREHIHLHFNKNNYLTNENIWLKGYVTNNKIPFYASTNIHLNMFDSSGRLVLTQLLLASNGLFSGTIFLNKKFKSGNYKIQVFTNYMNNFIENESSSYEIRIINPDDFEEIISNVFDERTSKISFLPESGVFLKGFSNIIGFKIEDCNENSIELKNVELLNSSNEVISTFNTNKFGVGKFEILDSEEDNYKIRYILNDVEKLEQLPKNQQNGVNFSVNNYSIQNKIILKIKKTSPKKESFKFLIFQESLHNWFPIVFPENKKELTIDIEKDLFYNGINTLVLIDEENNSICERLLFNLKPDEFESNSDLILTQKRTDSIKFTGKTNFKNGSLSISILPNQNEINTMNSSITTDIFINSFIENPSYISYEELSTNKRNLLYEMDKMLLNSKPKYSWATINGNKPESKFEFEQGLSIKGTVNTLEKNNGKLIVNMKAIGLGINNNAIINEKNEFEFKNVVAIDSTKIYLTVIDENRKKLNHKIYSTTTSASIDFLKPIYSPLTCEMNFKKIALEKQDYPKIEGAVSLDSVSIIANKNRLKHDNQKGNFYAKGFKITDEVINSNRDVLDFINKNGYAVSRSKGYVTINNYNYSAALTNELSRINLRGNQRFISGPAVFIDNLQILDYTTLEGMNLDTFDEIYIDKHNSHVAFANWWGSIKIFTKKNNYLSSISAKSEFVYIKNGFQTYIPYKLPKYASYGAEFKKFGSINWIPYQEITESGIFYFSIPNLYQKNVRILIEGISDDGRVISEIKEINIE